MVYSKKVMVYAVFIIVALFATILGSISGMGGGIIMKPVYDAIGSLSNSLYFSAKDISVMTASAVFAMSILSVLLSIKKLKEEKMDAKILIGLAIGSTGGGLLGKYLFSLMTAGANDNIAKIVQNCILFVIVIFIIIYMSKKGERKSLHSTSFIASLIVGFILGILASFLGIGGGPMNVAIIIFVFGYNIKLAVICSLTTIIFSQATSLITILVQDGTSAFVIDPWPLIITVVAAALIGATIGKIINKKVSDKGVNIIFLCVQVLVLILCLYNIITNSIAFAS